MPVIDKAALATKRYRLGEGKDGIRQVIDIPGLSEYIENKFNDLWMP